MNSLPSDALRQLFTDARTHNGWLDQPVTDETLHQLYDLARMGPTAVNSTPLRLVFVKSAEAKARLKPCLDAGNVDKTMAAPVTAIVAYDVDFHEQLKTLFPARAEAMIPRMAAMPIEKRERMAFMNGTLEAGYVIIAARALGLDCGPMGGFNSELVEQTFLAGTKWKANVLVNLGYGDVTKLCPRNPRLEFSVAARIE